MSRRDLVSWTTMMIGYETHGYGEEVVELFDQMVSPDQEIYGCEVDLLGRAGKVEEAYELIESMPFKPDECVWGPFLGACKATQLMVSGGVCKTKKVDEKNGK
ncbi:putative pentatricopeptide repeat-containing protein [Vitis vinifera]|uniref:Putative pentatricopeptide repeat-containing protein n=1 Tax=Vitis vinifera TaxID=29760 RepID=A0A438BM42_VITVI|nr:putative pentatricopeptide repeat-containing protein [Vitis vinifera]